MGLSKVTDMRLVKSHEWKVSLETLISYLDSANEEGL